MTGGTLQVEEVQDRVGKPAMPGDMVVVTAGAYGDALLGRQLFVTFDSMRGVAVRALGCVPGPMGDIPVQGEDLLVARGARRITSRPLICVTVRAAHPHLAVDRAFKTRARGTMLNPFAWSGLQRKRKKGQRNQEDQRAPGPHVLSLSTFRDQGRDSSSFPCSIAQGYAVWPRLATAAIVRPLSLEGSGHTVETFLGGTRRDSKRGEMPHIHSQLSSKRAWKDATDPCRIAWASAT